MDRQYMDNSRLEAVIASGDRDELARMLYDLAERAIGSQAGTLPPGLEVDDVKQQAVMECIRRLAKWEPGRSSAYSYARGSMNFTLMAARKSERAWAARHSALIDSGKDERP